MSALVVVYSLLLVFFSVGLGAGFLLGYLWTKRNARYLDIQDDWRQVLGLDK